MANNVICVDFAFLSYLKHQSREGAVSSGRREEVGEGFTAGGRKTEPAAEGAAGSGEIEAGGGGEGCRAAEQEAGKRESRCKVPFEVCCFILSGLLSCHLQEISDLYRLLNKRHHMKAPGDVSRSLKAK